MPQRRNSVGDKSGSIHGSRADLQRGQSAKMNQSGQKGSPQGFYLIPPTGSGGGRSVNGKRSMLDEGSRIVRRRSSYNPLPMPAGQAPPPAGPSAFNLGAAGSPGSLAAPSPRGFGTDAPPTITMPDSISECGSPSGVSAYGYVG